MDPNQFHQLLNKRTEAGGRQPWQQTGTAGYSAYHRSDSGLTVVEFGYDFAATLGESPRWLATIWRTLHAFETAEEHGRIAVLHLDGPAPIDTADDEVTGRTIDAAIASLRLAPKIADVVISSYF